MGWSRPDSGLEGALARTFAKEESELLWLAFLLTGDCEISMHVVVNAMDIDASNPFFRNWMISWSRKLVIAKALSSVDRRMGESVRRARQLPCPTPAEIVNPDWSLDSDTGKTELERALLAIDLFPRCALLLTVFEKVSIDDAASLLNVDRETVRFGKAIGLAELTRNLAANQQFEVSARAVSPSGSFAAF